MTYHEDEIDLRPYLKKLLRYWWQIALVGAILGTVALVFTILQPHTFKATATILVNRSRSQLSLAQEFPTLNEPVDQIARMNALLTLLNSDSMALDALNAMEDPTAFANEGVQGFQDLVKFENKGDAIQITATAESAELAAEVANTWAEVAIQSINQAYTEGQPLEEIQVKLVSAKIEYETRQTELESFIQSNKIAQLEQQLNQGEMLLAVISFQHNQKVGYYAEREIAMATLAMQAQALQEQIQSEGASAAGRAGDAIAVLMMRARAFGIVTGPTGLSTGQSTEEKRGQGNIPDSLSMNLNITELGDLEDSAANYVTDLARISEQARLEEQQAHDNLLAIIQGTDDDVESLTTIAVQVQEIKSQLEAENFKLSTITIQRDLALQAYQALNKKATEIQSGSGTASYSTLASRAIPPKEPTSRGTVRNTLIGGILGATLAMFWILGMEWWRSGKVDERTLTPQPATESMD